MCLSVFLKISLKPMQLESHLDVKSSAMSAGNSFILESKGPGYKLRKPLPAWVFALVCVLATSSCIISLAVVFML